MENYNWLGNISELRNVIERCVLLANDEVFPVRWMQLSGNVERKDPVPSGQVFFTAGWMPVFGCIGKIFYSTGVEEN